LIPFYKSDKYIIALNPDGLGFKRNKYPLWKKMLFYTQYFVASLIPEYLVCDSIGIKDYYRTYFLRRKKVFVIEYGTSLNPFLKCGIQMSDFSRFNLPYKAGEYHLIVSRLEPENNVKLIMEGYSNKKRKFPLVIVGNTNTPHSIELLKYQNEQIHFIGGVYDKEKLQLLRFGSLSYWHGHSVGGTNPSLLEAMGSANLCVCHDNVFNREVLSGNGLFFLSSGDSDLLFERVEEETFSELKTGALERAKNHYSWERITLLYLDLAKQVRGNI
jgi:glycosyltransferase involved in cell wall biosynthesis